MHLLGILVQLIGCTLSSAWAVETQDPSSLKGAGIQIFEIGKRERIWNRFVVEGYFEGAYPVWLFEPKNNPTQGLAMGSSIGYRLKTDWTLSMPVNFFHIAQSADPAKQHYYSLSLTEITIGARLDYSFIYSLPWRVGVFFGGKYGFGQHFNRGQAETFPAAEAGMSFSWRHWERTALIGRIGGSYWRGRSITDIRGFFDLTSPWAQVGAAYYF